MPLARSLAAARGGRRPLDAVRDLLVEAVDADEWLVCVAGLRNGEVGYASRGTAALLGVDRRRLVGRPLPELADAATRADLQALLVAGQDVEHAYVSLAAADGRAVPLDCRILFDGDRYLLLGDRRGDYGGREGKLFELNDELVVQAREGFRRAHRLERTVHELETALEVSAEKLRASFRRTVRARDEERRRVMRDLHDGAQQQLLAVGLGLDLVADSVDDPDLRTRLLTLRRRLDEGIGSLRDITHGIYPAALASHGIAEGIRSATFASTPPVELRARAVGRYPAEVEGAVYYTCVEAIQNAVKHARARLIVVELAERDGELLFSVRDDGSGFDPKQSGAGAGLRNVADRVRAAGGSLRVSSSRGGGTTVSGAVPLRGLDTV